MGMALTSCTVPAAGKPTFELGDDEMEIGIGIHGEPGRERMKLKPVAEIVEMMATVVVDDLPFAQGDDVLAFVNGMGGTPLIELYIVYNELAKFLKGSRISISRNLIGSYITSLEMAGCSITLLKASDDRSGCGTHRSRRRDSARASEWLPGAGRPAPRRQRLLSSRRVGPRGSTVRRGAVEIRPPDRAYADVIAENKDYLTQLDSAIGDADHGINMDRGMRRRSPSSTGRRATSGRCSRPWG